MCVHLNMISKKIFLQVTLYITINLDTDHSTMRIMLIALRKAFDVVDHSILLKKLEFHIFIYFLKYYLSSRSQFFRLITIYLRSKILCSVPQGSVLRSIILIYIFMKSCIHLKYWRTVIFYSRVRIINVYRTQYKIE